MSRLRLYVDENYQASWNHSCMRPKNTRQLLFSWSNGGPYFCLEQVYVAENVELTQESVEVIIREIADKLFEPCGF